MPNQIYYGDPTIAGMPEPIKGSSTVPPKDVSSLLTHTPAVAPTAPSSVPELLRPTISAVNIPTPTSDINQSAQNFSDYRNQLTKSYIEPARNLQNQVLQRYQESSAISPTDFAKQFVEQIGGNQSLNDIDSLILQKQREKYSLRPKMMAEIAKLDIPPSAKLRLINEAENQVQGEIDSLLSSKEFRQSRINELAKTAVDRKELELKQAKFFLDRADADYKDAQELFKSGIADIKYLNDRYDKLEEAKRNSEEKARAYELDVAKFGESRRSNLASESLSERKLQLDAQQTQQSNMLKYNQDLLNAGEGSAFSGDQIFGNQRTPLTPTGQVIGSLRVINRPVNTGNIANDLNNPGNLRAGGVGDRFAAGVVHTPQPGNPNSYFLVFDSPEAGRQAHIADIEAKISGGSRYIKPTDTLDRMLNVYAANPNSGYKNTVARALGVKLNTKIGSLDATALADAIQLAEGYTGAQSKEEINILSNKPLAGNLEGAAKALINIQDPTDRQLYIDKNIEKKNAQKVMDRAIELKIGKEATPYIKQAQDELSAIAEELNKRVDLSADQKKTLLKKEADRLKGVLSTRMGEISDFITPEFYSGTTTIEAPVQEKGAIQKVKDFFFSNE